MPNTSSSEAQNFSRNPLIFYLLGSDPKQNLVMGFRFKVATQMLYQFKHPSL